MCIYVLNMILIPVAYFVMMILHVNVLSYILPTVIADMLEISVIRVALHIAYTIYVNKTIIQNRNITGIKIFCMCVIAMLWCNMFMFETMYKSYLIHVCIREIKLIFLTYILRYLIIYNDLKVMYVSQYLSYDKYSGIINARFIASTIIILANIFGHGLFGYHIVNIISPVIHVIFTYIMFETCIHYTKKYDEDNFIILVFIFFIILENRMIY